MAKTRKTRKSVKPSKTRKTRKPRKLSPKVLARLVKRKADIDAIRDGAYAEGLEEGARLERAKRALHPNCRCTMSGEIRIDSAMWTMADGSKILVRQMDEDHLRNAISYLARNLVFKLGQTLYLADVKSKCAGLVTLLNEADRRGLKI